MMNARVRLCAALITGSTVVAGSMVLADSAWARAGARNSSAGRDACGPGGTN